MVMNNKSIVIFTKLKTENNYETSILCSHWRHQRIPQVGKVRYPSWHLFNALSPFHRIILFCRNLTSQFYLLCFSNHQQLLL